MLTMRISGDVSWIGVNDRTTDLFEGLWPISREGVSYNSYAINDEKKVLVDLAKAFKTDDFLERVNEVFDIGTIDCLVINHTEPDHTGALPLLCRLSPKMKIYCTAKAREMLLAFYHLEDARIHVVTDGEVLETGRHRLSFHLTPFLHWPDTMMTYDETDRILYSCDAFGGYGALSGAIFDDSCTDLAYYEAEAMRYYANIVALYSPMVLKGIEKLTGLGLAPAMVAPSHGLIWRRDPARIITLYREWAEACAGGGEPGVTLLYGSMYGNTEKYMNAVLQGVAAAGLPVEVFDVARTPASYILPAVMRYRGVLVGAPTYEAGLFPPMAQQLDMLERKGLRRKRAAIFGSRLWSGGAQKEFAAIAERLKWEVVEGQEWQGGASRERIDAAFAFGKGFAESLK